LQTVHRLSSRIEEVKDNVTKLETLDVIVGKLTEQVSNKVRLELMQFVHEEARSTETLLSTIRS